MSNRTQAGLEYLMTYGWALVLIVTLVGAIAFVIGPPAEQVTFASSNPEKILVKSGTISEQGAKLNLQNITGGSIKITNLESQGYDGCLVNNSLVGEGAEIVVAAGGQISIECDTVTDRSKGITIEYEDYAGLQRSVSITATEPTGEETPIQPGCNTVCDDSCAGVSCFGTDPDCDELGQPNAVCCGDGTCQADPNDEYCLADCSGPDVCCSGSCVAIDCFSDADCDDSDSCTADSCDNVGSCSASCSNEPIVSCTGGDGCCPAGCNANNDSDCDAVCGNTIKEPGETCDTCAGLPNCTSFECSEDCSKVYIAECGTSTSYTISSYYIKNTIYLEDPNEPCIIINDDHIELTCEPGAEIVSEIGPTDNGINITASNTEIRDCVIRGFDKGINSEDCAIELYDVTLTENNTGLYIDQEIGDCSSFYFYLDNLVSCNNTNWDLGLDESWGDDDDICEEIQGEMDQLTATDVYDSCEYHLTGYTPCS